MKITVIGAGSWGTALAVLLCGNGHQVTLWSHRPAQAKQMRETRQNRDKLPGVMLPEALAYTGDMEEAVQGRDLLVFAVPSAAMRDVAASAAPFVADGQMAVCVSKGIEEGTLMTQCGILEQELPGGHICVLSGPSHAEEVVMGLPTLVVAGAREPDVAETVQAAFMNEVFRVYTSSDVLGIEIGASLKNVIALAAGMSDGLGYGDNAKAALITRAIKEMTALATAMGGQPETLSGLAGTGDLIVTCSSRHSRNRKAGMLIGQGRTAAEAMEEVHMVVEGVYSAKAALALGEKYHVELPIIREVNRVLFDGGDAREAVARLMERSRKPEF